MTAVNSLKGEVWEELQQSGLFKKVQRVTCWDACLNEAGKYAHTARPQSIRCLK